MMGCKRVFLKNTNLTNDTNPFGMFLLIAIEFHEYAVRHVFASHFVKENSLKGMKYIAQWQATLGATPWGRGEVELRTVKGKSPIDGKSPIEGRGDLQSVLLLPLIGRHAGGLPTQGVVSLRSPCPGL